MAKKDKKTDTAFSEADLIAGLRSGKKLLGEDGLLTDLVQRVVNAALDAEGEAHISSSQTSGVQNRRNGYTRKQVKSDIGPLSVSTPRDRAGTFEPELIGKWQRDLGTGVADQILRLYARGMSQNDIRSELLALYGLEYATGAISGVIDRVTEEVVMWQQRALASCYVVIFLDAIHYKVRVEGKVKTQAIYSVYGIDVHGVRDVLGLSISDTEGAHQWGQIVSDLARRGVEEVFFFCVDGLNGFAEAIEATFPRATVQQCIVHKIRSSTRFVSDRDRKAVCSDLRLIYSAASVEDAERALETFEGRWNKKYPRVAKAWREDWTELVSFLDFGSHIRRMIYTTNPVEALHRTMRKVTKSKGAWVNRGSILKQLYLALQYNKKSWSKTVHYWSAVQRELEDYFGERYTKWLDE
ncbi:MAG: IS256 family transposase [Bacteroidia bacterium]